MNTYLLLTLSLMLCVIPSLGWAAQSVGGKSRVAEVTIFKDRAFITRNQSHQFKKGAYTLLFKGISTKADKDSFKVKMSDQKSVDVMGFRVAEVHLVESKNSEVLKLEKDLEKALSKSNQIYESVQGLLRKDNYLRELEEHYKESFPVKIHKNQWSRKSFAGFLSFVQRRGQALHKGWSRLFNDYQVVSKKIEKIRAEISINESPMDSGSYTVAVDLLVQRPGNYKARVSYLVGSVGWSPTYDLYLESKNKKASIEQSALIWQKTGEEWRNVKLRLSNIRTELNPKAPSISSYYLNYRKVEKVKTTVKSVEQNDKVMVGAGGGEDALSEAVEVNFETPGRQTILHGMRDVKVFIRGGKMSYDEELVVVPSEFEYAFKRVELRNPFSWQLPSGTLYLYRNGEYIDQLKVKSVPSRGILTVNAGIDHNLKIRQWREDKTEEPGLIDRRRHFQRSYTTKIHNYSSKAKKIRLFRQIPISEMEALKVTTMESTTPGFTLEKNHKGWLSWSIAVPARKSKEILLGVDVASPSDFGFSW